MKRGRYERVDDERREHHRLVFRTLWLLVGAMLIAYGIVGGVMSCRARLDACSKAGVSFWLCFDDDTRIVVPAGHSVDR